MASYETLATNYANNKVAEYEKKLTESLLNPLKQQKITDEGVLKTQYDKLISSLDYSGTKLQNQYATDAEAAYVNKTLSEDLLKTKLNQLGLATSGSGITQYYDLQTAYGQNLATLGAVLNEGLADIEQEKAGALSDYNASLQQLASDYLDRELSIKGNIQGMVDSYRQEQYNNYYNELVRQYQSYSSGGYGGGYGGGLSNQPTQPTGVKAGTRLITPYFDGYISASHAEALNTYGALGTKGETTNGETIYYQPAGVLGHGQVQPYMKAGKLGITRHSSGGEDISNQNIWYVPRDNTYWVWNGRKMQYENVTSIVKQRQQAFANDKVLK